MKTAELLEKYYQIKKEIQAYYHVLGIFGFDHQTIAPKKSIEKQNETMSIISNIVYKKQMDPENIELLKELYNRKNELNEYQKREIELSYDSYQKMINVTPELQMEYSIAANNGYMNWLNAKNNQDFNLFKDSLAKIVELQQQMVASRPNQKATLYDTILDDYEKNQTSEELDQFFNELKTGIICLLNDIKKSKKVIRTDFLSNKVKINKQEKFSYYLLKLIGFDLDAGVLSTTEHPFTSKIDDNDVRLTTHYYENMFVSNIFSTIHEGGHAIFGQNEPEILSKYFVTDKMSAAMHETISRMYENMVARSEEFIHVIYPKFHKLFKSEFSDVTEQQLYEAVNVVEPSLIRIEADELTYCLHIIIRYEIEKELLNGRINVEKAKELWNQKYQEYLGVTPQNDSEGILQDVHWSDGSFGYFPSYALGNVYAAQIFNKMQKEIDILALIKDGKVTKVKEWLSKNVFDKASMLDPKEWIIAITGEPLNTKYYLEYLNNKYRKLYEL